MDSDSPVALACLAVFFNIVLKIGLKLFLEIEIKNLTYNVFLK